MRWIRKFRHFIRHGQAYKKATGAAALGIGVLLFLAVFAFFPESDTNSVRTGLVIVSEILGVLLGAVLVVVVLLVEQTSRAQDRLTGLFWDYHSWIQSHIGVVQDGRRQLVKQVKNGDFALDQPVLTLPPRLQASTSIATYRDVIGALSSLLSVHRQCTEVNRGEIKQDLRDLEYTEDEVASITVIRATKAESSPERYFTLVDQALDLTAIGVRCEEEVSDLAMDKYRQYRRDGVTASLRRLATARRFFVSKSFAASLTLPTFTTVLAVLTVFGITDQTVYLPFYRSLVIVSMTGFGLSVTLTLVLVGKMLA